MSEVPPTSSQPEETPGSGSASAEDATEEYPVKFTFPCAEINKRSVGKFILKCCGNEGVADEQDNRLRRLLQGAITHLEKEEKDDVWTNAELTIYDKFADCYIMRAGQGEYKFLVHLDGRDEIEVISTERPSQFKKKLAGLFSYVSSFRPKWFSKSDSGGGGAAAADGPEEASKESEPKPAGKL